jgi:hypothetical protein
MRTDKKRQFAEMRQLTQLAVSNQLAQEYRRVSVKGIEQYRPRFLKSIAKCVPKSGNLDTLNRLLSVQEMSPRYPSITHTKKDTASEEAMSLFTVK